MNSSSMHPTNCSSASGSDQITRAQQAIYALRAASAILVDPRCRENDALIHINEARRALDLSPTGIEEPQSDRGLCGPNSSRPELMDEIDRLHRLTVSILQQKGLPEPGTVTARRWCIRMIAWLLPVTLVVLSISQPWRLLRQGPWRGQYFPTKNLEGEPIVRWDADIGFDWNKDPPMDAIPSDQFSVRWDSCLIQNQKGKVTFQLVSDDGSRMWIDNDLILNHWRSAPRSAVGKEIELDKGIHHIRVEYFEKHVHAAVFLLASFDGEIPMRISDNRLRTPLDDLDAKDPCAEVRSNNQQ